MKKLLEVQKEIEALSKDSKNPFFKSKYLDLPTLLKNVKPVLNAHGLILLQPCQGGRVLSYILDAETGEELAHSEINLPEIKDPQKLGAAITYFRRYTLTSLLAIEEQDDDGNKASKPEPPKSTILNDLLDCANLEELQQVWNSKKKHTKEEEKIKNELKEKLKTE